MNHVESFIDHSIKKWTPLAEKSSNLPMANDFFNQMRIMKRHLIFENHQMEVDFLRISKKCGSYKPALNKPLSYLLKRKWFDATIKYHEFTERYDILKFYIQTDVDWHFDHYEWTNFWMICSKNHSTSLKSLLEFEIGAMFISNSDLTKFILGD